MQRAKSNGIFEVSSLYFILLFSKEYRDDARCSLGTTALNGDN